MVAADCSMLCTATGSVRSRVASSLRRELDPSAVCATAWNSALATGAQAAGAPLLASTLAPVTTKFLSCTQGQQGRGLKLCGPQPLRQAGRRLRARHAGAAADLQLLAQDQLAIDVAADGELERVGGANVPGGGQRQGGLDGGISQAHSRAVHLEPRGGRCRVGPRPAACLAPQPPPAWHASSEQRRQLQREQRLALRVESGEMTMGLEQVEGLGAASGRRSGRWVVMSKQTAALAASVWQGTRGEGGGGQA